MNNKMILGLMATLTCLDTLTSSENSKFKMAFIGGTTLVVGAVATYKACEYYRAQHIQKKSDGNIHVKSTPQKSVPTDSNDFVVIGDAQQDDQRHCDELNKVGGVEASNAPSLSAFHELSNLLHNVVYTQQNHEERLTVLETMLSGSSQSSPIGNLDETSSWSAKDFTKHSSQASLEPLTADDQISIGMDQSTLH